MKTSRTVSTVIIRRRMASYLHQQRVSESQSALQILPEGIVQKAGAGDLFVFIFVHDELRGLT